MWKIFINFWEDTWHIFLGLSLIGLVLFGGYRYNLTLEADVFCYDKVDHIRKMASYGEFNKKDKFEAFLPEYYVLIPEMNRFAEDGILTKGECSQVNDYLEKADGEFERKRMREKLF